MANKQHKGWEITFTDMLILLLTFFVFIISISRFETFEYKKLWERAEEQPTPRQTATTSFKFDLIKELKLMGLSETAEQLLNDIQPVFVDSDFDGVDVNYDEHKITLMVSEELSFEPDKTDLKEESKPLLLKLVRPINQTQFDVNVEGHTDALTAAGIDPMELSLHRALTVARFLIANGLDKQKISVSAYGPHRPIATNKTVAGRQLNRRVEVNIMIRND